MANYRPAPTDDIVAGAEPATELLSRVGGFIAGCGWASLDVILHWSKGESVAPEHVTAIIKEAVAAHQTVGAEAAGGQSTPANIHWIALKHGVTLNDVDYNTALAQAGNKPVEIGVSNARAFGGNDTNVRGHYVTVVGKTKQGNFITSDPNSSESISGKFVQYSHAQFDAAQPFWAGVPSGTGGGGSSSGGDFTSCGPYPIPSNYLFGYSDPQYWLDVAVWAACSQAAQVPDAIGGAAGGILGGVGTLLGDALGAVAAALKRVGVFVFGAILLIVGLWAAFHHNAPVVELPSLPAVKAG